MFPGPFGCIFWVKILKFFDVDPGRDGKHGSGMENRRVLLNE
jgi:hypothetical protein